MNEPIGALCVMRDDDASEHWVVSICQGNGYKLVLRRFESQDQAGEFAIEERARRMQIDAGPMTIHFPDDCPCRGGGMKW